MDRNLIFLVQPAFGVFAAIAATWTLVEVLNNVEEGLRRAGTAALAAAALIWLSAAVATFLHFKVYGSVKGAADSWVFAHGYVVAVREHLFILLVLTASYLPIVVCGNHLMVNPGARRLAITISALVAILALGIETLGALVDMETRSALSQALAG